MSKISTDVFSSTYVYMIFTYVIMQLEQCI